MEEREWMRERALEMDSHQDCIGSSEVVMVAVVMAGFGVVVVVVEEMVEEDGELPKSMAVGLQLSCLLFLPSVRRRRLLWISLNKLIMKPATQDGRRKLEMHLI
ncbi:hypothetical protein PanWU01x14_285650 [Parasponia andersonii]|uniref:Transmembrane protein n=1 Tax=Parasponia andersonii TaxID=3476 RepID=A0A2P5AZB9_PARAD|nr:hypothetical protein PanWU01x14_285650 [Parasponia andersonii]